MGGRYINGVSGLCGYCHNVVIETNIPYDIIIKTDFSKSWTVEEKSIEWYRMRQFIWNHIIEPLGHLDKSNPRVEVNRQEYFAIDITEPEKQMPQNNYRYDFDDDEEDRIEEEIERRLRDRIILEEHERKQNHIVKCPACGSTSTTKLSAVDRGVSIFALGLASNKIGKSFKCNKCGNTF